MLEASYLQEGFAMEVDAQSLNDMEFNVEEGVRADFPVKAGAFPFSMQKEDLHVQNPNPSVHLTLSLIHI